MPAGQAAPVESKRHVRGFARREVDSGKRLELAMGPERRSWRRFDIALHDFGPPAASGIPHGHRDLEYPPADQVDLKSPGPSIVNEV